MKKKLVLMLSAVMVFGSVLSGCGKGNSDTTAPSGSGQTEATQKPGNGGAKQLTVQLGPNPETIDPALNSAVDGGNMILHAYETLLILDKDNQIQPGQAESYEISEDGLTWTFTLRDGLKWSDGTALTADDFVYSWKRLCDPDVAAPYAETVLNFVKGFEEAAAGNLDALGVSAPDEKTFVVELTAPCTFFASIAAFPALSPVQQATIEANGDGWATKPETYISNGTFYVSEWVPGSYITMSKNTNYWNADAIKLDSIKFLLMEDSNAAYGAYKTGEALMIKEVPIEEVPGLTGNPEFFVEPIIGTYYVSLQNEKEPFTNPLVRKALSLAIDRDYVANVLMQGTYSPASNFVGPGWSDTDGSDFMSNANGGKPYIDNSNFEANLEEAKNLLAQAGYPGGEGLAPITYSTNDSAYHKVVAEYLQQAWAELGVTLNVEILEWSSFTSTRRSGDYETARDGWNGDYNDPSNILDCLYSTNGNNNGKFKNEKFDEQMDIARSTVDLTERSAALHAAEDILMEEAACIPIAYYNDFWLQSEKLSGSWHSPYGYWHFMYADIAE